MSINTVCISGNLTQDPEHRATASGTGLLTFSVAVNDRVRSQSTGEWEDRPNYFDCKVWGRQADSLATRLSKGAKVCVAGKLRQESWQAKDGTKRSKVVVQASEVQLMGSTASTDSSAERMVKSTFGTNTDVYSTDDIPF